MKITIRIAAALFLFTVISYPHLQTFASGASDFNPAKLEFRLIANGLTQPLFITNAGDGSERVFIIEKVGRIRILENSSIRSTPFLDIHSIVNSTGGEQGLLALAFHPSYKSNGQFYTVHTTSNGSLVLSRFIRSSTNPDLADPGSRITLLTIPHPTRQNHNGGTLAFGPDGYLYWSTGDGGGGGDPSNNAQNLSSLLGKILRLDVDSGSPYSIPASNPFYNSSDASIRKEIWAYGLRNPWRVSFDRQTGDLYIGDVGQSAHEEIDFQPSSSSGGENYGWRVMEGSFCYNPISGCNRSGKVLPVAEYTHSLGCAVTGGYVYRGSHYLPLQGYYFYGDYCTGVLFSLRNDPSSGWTATRVADTPYFISSFGEAENGELYLADLAGGAIYQVRYNPDVLAPGDITGLTATTGTSNGSVNLSWIAPPDDAGDNNSGRVTSYLVKYSTSAISSETDWNNATVVNSNLPAPTAPGTVQSMTVSGLKPSTLYYFAVRAQDKQPNPSVNFAAASASTKTPPTVTVGTYDDTDAAWTYYNGSWSTYSGTGPYNKTDRYSSMVGSEAQLTFNGNRFTFTYVKAHNRGLIDVYLDDTKIDTIDAKAASTAWKQTWTSPSFTAGVHTVRFVHAGGGTYIDVDAIQIFAPPPVVDPGIYDDLHPGWTFSNGWTTYSGTGPYNKTDRYSNIVGSEAQLTFNGSGFTFTYVKAHNRGLIDVYVDGTKIAQIDAYSASTLWQATWISPALTPGVHTVRFVHAGGRTYIDIDAIQILDTPLTVGAGTYDDNHAAWVFSSGWTTYSGAGPLSNTDHYSNAVGSEAQLIFNGSGFTFTYVKAHNRGLIDVYVDGTKVGQINAKSTTTAWQQVWSSPTLSSGTHTVRFVHAGGGTYIDVDAITILP